MKKMFLGAVVALTMFSCGGNSNMNDKIVTVYDKYISRTDKLIDNLDKGTNEERQKTLAEFVALTDSCATAMKEIKPTKEAEAFHIAVLDVYALVNAELIPAYKEFVVIDDKDESNANIDKYNKATDKINAATQKVGALEDKAQAEQRVFAAAAGMKLK